jgi:hypothetical protein
MVAGMVGGAVGASMSGLGVASSSLKIARAAFGGQGASPQKPVMKEAKKKLTTPE